ncbi:MAG TPA: HAD family phosphatase [Candidatus Acidoferrales bacterium]|nr:HAD family phosphatase [Candidatus Acidoferrales bacterium]
MIKAILWDNDGVLVDTEYLYFTATQQLLASEGITLTEEMYVDLLLVQGRSAWHLAEAKGMSPAEVSQLRDQRNALYLKLVTTEARVIDGVEEVLSVLHGRYLMGVVTSSRREHFEAVHSKTGLMKYFTFVLTGDDYSKFKPDPEPYLLAVQKTGFKPEECIAVEDSERGLTAATDAGLKCIVIPRGLTRFGKFQGAYKILKSIRELPAEISRA